MEKLTLGSTQEELLIQKIKESWKVEEHILTLISERETFHHLFKALLKGEYIVRQLTATESKFVARAEKETRITKKLLMHWVIEINLRLGGKISEWIIREANREQHEDSHFEFVNNPDFVPFAREVIQSMRKGKAAERAVSESAVNSFVHAFREYYNKQVKL